MRFSRSVRARQSSLSGPHWLFAIISTITFVPYIYSLRIQLHILHHVIPLDNLLTQSIPSHRPRHHTVHRTRPPALPPIFGTSATSRRLPRHRSPDPLAPARPQRQQRSGPPRFAQFPLSPTSRSRPRHMHRAALILVRADSSGEHLRQYCFIPNSLSWADQIAGNAAFGRERRANLERGEVGHHGGDGSMRRSWPGGLGLGLS